VKQVSEKRGLSKEKCLGFAVVLGKGKGGKKARAQNASIDMAMPKGNLQRKKVGRKKGKTLRKRAPPSKI